jgi:hypothetical protein
LAVTAALLYLPFCSMAKYWGRMIDHDGGTERPFMSGKKISITGSLLLVLLVVCAGTARSADELKPPAVYIDKGACPFECCTYREWVARTDVTLLNLPDGKSVVGLIKKGEKVLALTGEIHSVPQPVVARRDFPDARVKSGDTVYVLHYVGEGYWKIWHDGKVDEIEDFPGAGSKPKATWWVQLKISTGAVGWAVEHKNFDNQDACG